jgi:hypothetical protein
MSATSIAADSGRKRKIGDRKIQKTLWLTPEEAALLAALSESLGVSEADTLRHGIRFLSSNTYLPSEEAFSPVPLGVKAERAKRGRPRRFV